MSETNHRASIYFASTPRPKKRWNRIRHWFIGVIGGPINHCALEVDGTVVSFAYTPGRTCSRAFFERVMGSCIVATLPLTLRGYTRPETPMGPYPWVRVLARFVLPVKANDCVGVVLAHLAAGGLHVPHRINTPAKLLAWLLETSI